MIIVETSTVNKHRVKISLVESIDYKQINKKRYFFD